jgi:hypothetical protein
MASVTRKRKPVGLGVSTVGIKAATATVKETNEVLTSAARSALRSLPFWLGNCPSLQWHYLIKLVWHLTHSLAHSILIHISIYLSVYLSYLSFIVHEFKYPARGYSQ